MRLKLSPSRSSLLLAALFSAAPAFSTDLMQVYRDALTNDQQYMAARATADALREKEPQGLSGLLPTISGTANTTWNENKYSASNQPQKINRDFNTNAYNVNLTQPLFRWQNIVQYSQGKLQVVQAEANFAQASQDLILRVAQAYFDVLYAEENLKAVRANKQSIAQQLEQAKKNFEVGTATITDSQEAQSRFDLASAQEIAAENDLEVKRFALSVIIGKHPGELNRLKPQAELKPPQPASMDPWVDAAEKDSFVVQAQQAAAEVAAKEVERNRAGHYPTLDVVANYGKNNSALSFLGNDSLETTARNIGLQLNIPLFQGGYVNSKTREAAANRSAAQATLENTKRTAALNARQSYLGVVNGLAQVRALNAALISSTSALESNKLGYEVGVRINIDVLNAENQVYITKRDLARARFDTLLSQLRLKAAVGSLGEADLEQINSLFEAP
ncbi:MAG: TolC family outer membrane protein [Propionivibrio sp.]|nr:TolC family outer membrane protein [Propionivibrio sp.]MBK7564050.1 TolC family outer membrane protein [Propionivibrio sp.]MBK9028422.1 TolC family outer membrane protein [Propionivibrio sp.]HRC59925.1 TolC family outer membrane protein [Candidatus Propionivibrio aalborgensis]